MYTYTLYIYIYINIYTYDIIYTHTPKPDQVSGSIGTLSLTYRHIPDTPGVSEERHSGADGGADGMTLFQGRLLCHRHLLSTGANWVTVVYL